MSAIISHARFHFDFPVATWKKEVLDLPDQWQAHFNTHYYDGGWTVLPLRSPGGRLDGIIPDNLSGEETFADTLLLASCPSIRNWLLTLQSPLMAVRFLNLKVGAEIKTHRDFELSFEQGEARLHIPIVTNPGVMFQVNTIPLQMNEGECWYINANLPHQVRNNGSTDRIHLVVDCKVNVWLQERFREATCFYVQQESDIKEQLMIIAELRKQKTPTANQFADELESKLNVPDSDKKNS